MAVFGYDAPELAASLLVVVVGQPVSGNADEEETLTDVRRTDARSAQIGGPDCIAQCFQVNPYSVEPRPAVSARNLLSKDNWRAALTDEAEPLRPEVALVVGAFASASDGEGLTGARAGPDRLGVGPAGETECVAPDSNAGEEVRLSSLCNIDM